MHTHTPAATLGYQGLVLGRAGSKFWDLTISPEPVVQGGKTCLDYKGMFRNRIKHSSEWAFTRPQKQARMSVVYFK